MHGEGEWQGGLLTGNKTGEERLVLEVCVVLLEVLFAGGNELDGDELEAAVLEALDDGADDAALDAVGLDGDETISLSSAYMVLSW